MATFLYPKNNPKARSQSPLFLKSAVLEVSLLGAVLFSCALIFLDQIRPGGIIRPVISFLSSPVQTCITSPFTFVNWLGDIFSTHEDLARKNQLLKANNLLLKGRLQTFAAILAENERLRVSLGSTSPFAHSVALAERIQVIPDPFSHRVMLNKGRKWGVYQGQPVIDAEGVVGQITQVSDESSEAILITDPRHALPAQVLRNGVRVLVMGTGSLSQLEIPFMPDPVEIKVGDILVTSSLGKRFPSGYPVAKIRSIQHEGNQPFAKIIATPLAKLDRAEQVLLIWPKANKDDP